MKHVAIVVLISLRAFTAHAQWTNGQDAQYVVGQTSFTTNLSATSSTGLKYPAAIAIDVAHSKMYIADYFNHRVLRYVYPLTGSGKTADRVFGQNTMSSGSINRGAASPSANTLSNPNDVTVYNGDLWVADYGNHRVVKYAAAYNLSSNGPNADVVLGQSDMTTKTSGVTASTMNNPIALEFDGSGNLWVADQSNNRVLRFSTLTTGSSADKVLGQPNFTTQTAADPPTQSSISIPGGMAFSGTTLWVVDQGTHRVLRFDNAASKSNGGLADGVLGQSNYSSYSPGNLSNKFYGPARIAIDELGRLYVSEINNNRIAIFDNAATKVAGSAMDNVIGQTSTSGNSSGTTQSTLYDPVGLTIDNANGKLLVADQYNHRILQYSSSSSLPVELSFFSVKSDPEGAILIWRTATETNNYGFEIERKSTDTWRKIGFVEGHGTTNAPQSYSYADNSVSGKSVYRLKQIDLDGMFIYSNEVEAEISIAPTVFGLSQNYPNPFNPSTVIAYSIASATNVTLRVYDMVGREVAVLVNGPMLAGNYSVEFNSSGLSSGVYFYRLDAGSFADVKRLSIMK